MIEKRKVVLVGTGFVGMSMAYALLNQGGINELVLVDVLKDKAEGEAMDLQHAMSFAPNDVEIKSAGYEECKDADVVVITAGLAQKPGQTRLELASVNTKIMKEITESVMASGFDGIFVIASNPVDLMTYVVKEVSGLPRQRVIGSGTTLDTSRLKYYLGKYCGVSTRSINAYVMGEHGDSSFVPWDHAYVGVKSLSEIMREQNKPVSDLNNIYTEVQQAAYEVINKKRATYYGIGLGLTKIVKTILNNENEVLTISTLLDGEYGHSGISIGVPAIVNKDGIKEIIDLHLAGEDKEKFDKSVETLTSMKAEIDKVIHG